MGFRKEGEKENRSVLPKIKNDRIRSTWPRRVGKIVLWAILILILVRGVSSLLSGSRVARQQESLEQYIAAAELRETTRAGAAAFAENFIRDYYTFTGITGTDYKERVGNYLAKSLDIRDPMAGICKTEVIVANAVSVNFSEVDQLNVDVNVKVHYTPIGEQTIATADKNFTIRVPIVVKKNAYAVDALPQYVSMQEAADISKADAYTGSEVDSKEKEKVKVFLDNFLRVYYTGNSSELAYYLTPEFNQSQGIKGVVEFDRIKNLAVYYLVDTKEYLIDVSIIVLDNGQQIEQHLILSAVLKDDEKYYMKSIQTRI